jgi:hypothetical protein
MAEPSLLHLVYYEGDDDGAVLRGLEAAGLLPEGLRLTERKERQRFGKEGMVQDLAPLVRPVNGAGRSAIAIRDFDDLEINQLTRWFSDTLSGELPKVEPPLQIIPQKTGNERILFFRIPCTPHTGQVILVAVGLPGDQKIKEYGTDQFTVDDYVLRLAHDREVFDSVTEFKGVEHALALRKLTEVVDLMRRNELQVKNTKRLLHLLRGVTGFRASPATFASRLIEKATVTIGKERLRQYFTPLLDDLEEATRILTG